MVLAHEHAHIGHFDVLKTFFMNGMTCLHLPGVGKSLRNEWQLAIEQRCDAAVARRVGDRVAVADCLVQIARLLKRRAGGRERINMCALVDDNLSARVHALLAGPGAVSRPPVLTMAGMGLFGLLAVVISGRPIHRWMEALLPAVGL